VRLIPLLEKLPVEVDDHSDRSVGMSIGAWEIFAQIFAQQLDPLDAKRVDALADVRARHMDEVRSLRNKCHRLAADLPPTKDLLTLISTVEAFLRHNVNDEIAALFDLNREAVGGFIEAVLTDEKSWAAVAAAIGTPFAGQPLLTAGAAIATVSSLGAKAAKSAFERRSKLKASDYRVLYRVGSS